MAARLCGVFSGIRTAQGNDSLVNSNESDTMSNETPEGRVLKTARELVQGCEDVIANVELLAVETQDQTPIDCEGFRVALFYARQILAAAERGEFDRIDLAWLEPIKQVSVESASCQHEW